MKIAELERELFEAVQRNDESSVLELVLSYQEAGMLHDVNHGFPAHFSYSLLDFACWNGHFNLASLLLRHPHINVNRQNETGTFPLFLACANGRTEIVKALLLDPRVILNTQVKEGNPSAGQTPLWSAARQGRTDLIKWMIASGKTLDPNLRAGKHKTHPRTTPLEVATKMERGEAAELIQLFIMDPVGTRKAVQAELGMEGIEVAEIFALAVYLSDGYLGLTPSPPTATSPIAVGKERARKFWKIISQLPLELQMVLCNRVCGSLSDHVLRDQSEPAFKKLGIILTRMEHEVFPSSGSGEEQQHPKICSLM